jgi:hypothetical protein
MNEKPAAQSSPGQQRALNRERRGQIAVQLALRFPEWVRRRRFTIEFVDDTTFRQRMSVDFMLPHPDWFWAEEPPEEGEVLYVPLHLPRKDTLTNFSVSDESGTRLSTLTTDENGGLATAGLLPVARQLASERYPIDDDELRGSIERIVMATKSAEHDPVTEVLNPSLAGVLGKIFSAEDEAKALLRDLADGFLLLVPIEYRHERDRVVKLEWELPNFWHGRTNQNRVLLYLQSFLASIAWADKRQNIPDLQLGWARSTHIEVVAPDDVELTAASLNVVQYDPALRGPVGVDALRVAYDRPRLNLNTSIRVAFDPDTPDEADQDVVLARGDTGSVDVLMRTPAAGVLVAALVASAITSVLLWIVAGRLTELDG